MANSENSKKFSFNTANAKTEKQEVIKETSPVEETSAVEEIAEPVQSLDFTAPAEVSSLEGFKATPVAKVEQDYEYTDVRRVTIMLVKNYSLYRKANDKTLPKRKDFIGSSVYSSRILSANKEEVDTYFPNIIGLSPSDPNFVMRVKQHLNNIRIPIDELGKTFDISFHYYKKSSYNKIKSEEDKIEQVYQNANKQDISKLRAALKDKITQLNALESTKCKLGYPINVDDYLMYRHCLLYNDVAKDMALINSDSNVRFYFKDEQKEAEKLRKFRMEVNSAKTNYVSCLADNELFEAVYIQFCVLNDMPVISSIAEDRLEREIKLDKFSTDEPVKFNKIFKNRDVRLIADIEMLIARGELVRSQYNQNITTPDGDFIGSNMTEAVAWFKNPENASVVNVYKNKLKLI